MSDTPRTDAELQETEGNLSGLCRQLERENAALREAMRSAIDEISWFVVRQKDLMGDNGEGKPWSAVLNDDLNILRNALSATESA